MYQNVNLDYAITKLLSVYLSAVKLIFIKYVLVYLFSVTVAMVALLKWFALWHVITHLFFFVLFSP